MSNGRLINQEPDQNQHAIDQWNSDVSRSNPSDAIVIDSRSSPGFSWYGVIFAAGAALSYTMANVFLRDLAGNNTPHEWVVTCKASCTTIIFLPWLVFLAIKGAKLFPPWKVCGLLLFAAVFVQLAGNLAYQWSLAQIGLALSIPILMSILIISGATLGRVFLHEPVSLMMKTVIVMFVVAIFMLGLGAATSAQTEVAIQSKTWPIAGAIAASMAGLAYAVLGVSIRTSMKHHIPLATPMVIVGLTGAILIGSITFANHGTSIVAETSGHEWFCLIGGALCNSAAFLCLTKAFKHLPVVYVNATNVAQIAMATLIALTWFEEKFTTWLGLGLLIILVGYVMLAWQKNQK